MSAIRSPMRSLLALASMLILALSPVDGHAQGYPNRPIRVVVPYPPGGVADKLAREVANELQMRVNQPVLVENRSGASGNIGFETVARMPADGYTLLMAPASNLTVQKALFRKLGYDLDKDFAPVSVLLQTPQVLVVNASLPIHDVKELVAYASKNPGRTNFGAIIGAYQHLAGEMLKAQTKADFEAVAYQGPAPALNDLLGGQTQFMFTEMMNVLPFVADGRLRSIAVTSPTRTPWMPEVPTMTELGFSDFDVSTWYSFVIHSGTPRPIIDQLAREIRAVVTSPDFRKRYADLGAFTVGSTPDEMQAFVRKESTRWTAVVKRVGIQPN